jgi:hypothetical protein
VVDTTSEPNATPLGYLSDSDRELVADVLAAFSKHPSIARSVKLNPLHTSAAQATSRRVAAMIREGVRVDALASATTTHLDVLYRQTRAANPPTTVCTPTGRRVALRRPGFARSRLRDPRGWRNCVGSPWTTPWWTR